MPPRSLKDDRGAIVREIDERIADEGKVRA